MREKRKAMLPSQRAMVELHSALKDREFKSTSEENRYLRDTVRDLEGIVKNMRSEIQRLGLDAQDKANELDWLKEHHDRPFRVDVYAKEAPPPPPVPEVIVTEKDQSISEQQARLNSPNEEVSDLRREIQDLRKQLDSALVNGQQQPLRSSAKLPGPSTPSAPSWGMTEKDQAFSELQAQLISRNDEVSSLRREVQDLRKQLDSALEDILDVQQQTLRSSRRDPRASLAMTTHHHHSDANYIGPAIPAFVNGGGNTDILLRRQLADALQRAYGIEERESMRLPSAPTERRSSKMVKRGGRRHLTNEDDLNETTRSDTAPTSPSVATPTGSTARDVKISSGEVNMLREKLTVAENACVAKMNQIQEMKDALLRSEVQRGEEGSRALEFLEALRAEKDAKIDHLQAELESAKLTRANEKSSEYVEQVLRESEEKERQFEANMERLRAQMEELRAEKDREILAARVASRLVTQKDQSDGESGPQGSSTDLLDSFHLQLEELRNACTEKDCALTSLKEDRENLQQKLQQERERTREEAKTVADHQSALVLQLQKEVEELRANKGDEQIAVATLESQLNKFAEEQKTLTAELETLRVKEKASADLEKEVGRLRMALKDSYDRWEKTQKGLEEKIEKAEVSKAEALKGFETKTGLLRKEQEKYATLQKTMEKAQEDANTEITEERARTVAANAALQKAKEALDAAKATHDAELEKLHKEIKLLRNDNEYLRTNQMQ